MSLDRKYLVWSLAYVVAGMGLGIFMAATHDYGQRATHTHILLVGFVGSLAYGLIHKLWPSGMHGLAKTQFFAHQAGAVTMSTGLMLLHGNAVPEAQIGPVLAIASAVILLGGLLMLFMVLRANIAKA